MKLSQMRYFSASCHAGNISRAAEELHIAQPSVTAAIKALEDELGVSLLEVSHRPPAGLHAPGRGRVGEIVFFVVS